MHRCNKRLEVIEMSSSRRRALTYLRSTLHNNDHEQILPSKALKNSKEAMF